MSGTEPTDHTPQLWLLRAAKAVVVLVYVFVLIDLVLLALGFFLRLFGASTDAEFTRWVYRNVDRIMEPFRGMFPARAVSDVSVLDVSLLFAMIVYAIIGIALHALVEWLTGKIVARRRSAFLLKLALTDRLGLARGALVDAQHEALADRLRELAHPPDDPTDVTALWRHHTATAVREFLASVGDTSAPVATARGAGTQAHRRQIGRVSCRERV